MRNPQDPALLLRQRRVSRKRNQQRGYRQRATMSPHLPCLPFMTPALEFVARRRLVWPPRAERGNTRENITYQSEWTGGASDRGSLPCRDRLSVEPEVFEAPAIANVVHHDGVAFRMRLPAGRPAV